MSTIQSWLLSLDLFKNNHSIRGTKARLGEILLNWSSRCNKPLNLEPNKVNIKRNEHHARGMNHSYILITYHWYELISFLNIRVSFVDIFFFILLNTHALETSRKNIKQSIIWWSKRFFERKRILISSEHLFFYLGYVCVTRETCKTKYKRKRKGVPNNQSNLNHKFLQCLLTQLKPLIYYLYFTLYYFEDRRFLFLFYLGKRERINYYFF